MSEKEQIASGNWFVDLIMTLAPKPDDINVTGTPEEMTRSASWEAFMISTTAGLVPGPFGWATILPELIAITKIQINLVYKIAQFHNQSQKINKTMLLMILGNATGTAAGRLLLRKVGTRVIVKSMSLQAIRNIAQKIGARIGARVVSKMAGRMIFFITAPIFGAFSKAMTTQIGNEADAFFAQDIEVEKVILCSQGHEMLEGSKFCPECGEKMSS